MKPDYKNWMPKGMVLSAIAATAVFLILFILFGLTGIISGPLKTVSFVVFLSLIPEILRLLGIVLFLRGVRRLKRKMRDGAVRRKPAKETEEKKSRGLAYSRHWFLAAVIMILSVPVTLFLCNFVYLFSLGVLKWIGLFVSVVYLSFSVLLGIRIRSFCQEYYLYRYNQG